MIKKFLLLTAMCLSGCGYSSVNNELIGQVKRVHDNTPIICPSYTDVDISLGVMRNGVGSMSKEDAYLYVPNTADRALLRAAAEAGSLVKVQYNEFRFVFCRDESLVVTHVERVN